MTLALSPTNPPSPGTLYRLLTLNDGEILVEVIDAGVAGATVPLSNVLFSDVGTVVPGGSQNGSQATPFHLAATSIAAAPVNGVVVLTPGNYGPEGILTIANNVNILSYQPSDGTSVTLNQLVVNANKVLQATGLQLTANLVLNAGSVFVGREFQCLNILAAGVGSVVLNEGCVITGTVSCDGLLATETTFGNDITISQHGATFIECNFPLGGHSITFTSPGPNFLTLDATSFRNFLSAGMILNGATIISNDFLPPAATTATLATPAYANVPNGETVYVASQLRSYCSVPVGNGDAVGTGNDWKSNPSTSSPAWRAQATWFISNAGNDNNSGIDLAHPLLTVAELQSRWGVNPIISIAVQITFSTAHPGGTLRYIKGALGALVQYASTPVVVLTTTVGTYATVNTGTNVWARLTSPGVADFTPYVNARARFPLSGAVAPIALVSPQAAGVTVAEIGLPGIPLTAGNSYFGGAATPAPGDVLIIETLPQIDFLKLVIDATNDSRDDGAGNVNRPAVLIESMRVDELAISTQAIGTQDNLVWGSELANFSWQFSGVGFDMPYVTNTLIRFRSVLLPTSRFNSCVMKSGVASVTRVFSYSDLQTIGCLFEGLGWTVVNGTVLLQQIGLFNGLGFQLGSSHESRAFTAGYLLGQGNTTYGVTLTINSRLAVNAGTVLKATGATGDWHFAGGAAFTWAETPRQMNSGAVGALTLTGGVVAFSVPNLPADAVVIPGYLVPAVGALALGIDTQTTSGGNIKSLNAADNTSTVRATWYSAASGSGGIFNG